ncbi:hypothetical protein CEXT_152781 [Caerostris extrusa]|uniref:Uncharacterized protein n=1 Tax=Caerostris extrusa TaxID=172846 RepID=A0AAV4TUG1_CAEEX|nr:hypothetical protein CEXT_152781 [Caerostris extrusa]
MPTTSTYHPYSKTITKKIPTNFPTRLTNQYPINLSYCTQKRLHERHLQKSPHPANPLWTFHTTPWATPISDAAAKQWLESEERINWAADGKEGEFFCLTHSSSESGNGEIIRYSYDVTYGTWSECSRSKHSLPSPTTLLCGCVASVVLFTQTKFRQRLVPRFMNSPTLPFSICSPAG